MAGRKKRQPAERSGGCLPTGGFGGPQPLAGKQPLRVPIRSHDLTTKAGDPRRDSIPSSDSSLVIMKIDVRDNQIEPALKALKKLMLKDGLFQEMKRREHYEKPSVKRKQKQARARKKLRKAMKRDSLGSDE